MTSLLARVRAARLLEPRVIGFERGLGTKRSPERAQLALDERMRLLVEPVVDPRALAPAVDDAGVLQDPQLTRRIRLAQAERFLEVADAKLPVNEQRDDAKTRLVTERAKHLRERSNIQ